MKLEALDLNLLLAFDALAAERSVTRAAAKVGLSQPAMSNALGRLRGLFNDPLFERVEGQMQPTARARELLVPIGEVIARLREVIEPQPSFLAAEAEREFKIIGNDYIEELLVPSLIRELQKRAPSILLRFLRPAYLFEPPVERLAAGEADLAIGFYGEIPASRGNLLTTALFEDRFVCIVRAAHPRVGRTLELAAFLEIPQVRVLYPGDSQTGIIDTILKSRRLTRKVALAVPHLVSVPAVVAKSDLLGIVPERLARRVAKARRLRVFDVPIPLPPIHVMLAWHERRQFDSAMTWLRGVIADLI